MQGIGGGSSAVEETFLRFLLMLEMTGTFSRRKQERAACFLGRETCFLAGLWLQAAERWLPQTAEGETRGVFVSHPCELPG